MPLKNRAHNDEKKALPSSQEQKVQGRVVANDSRDPAPQPSQAQKMTGDAPAWLEATLGAAQIGTWAWDMASHRVRADKHLARIFSLCQQELEGVPVERFFALIHPQDLGRVKAALQETLEGRTPELDIDFRLVQADGSERWMTARGNVERDGDQHPVRFSGVTLDITQRRKREEQLEALTRWNQAQTRLFDATLSSINDLAYTFDLEGNWIYANKPLLHLWGKSLEEIVGKSSLELGYPPELAERLRLQVRQVIETRKPFKGETFFTDAAGVEDYHEYIFSPVFAADGSVAAVCGTTRLVTERKRTEQNTSFLFRLGQKLALLSDPEEINRTATQELGRFLGANRCYFCEWKGALSRIEIRHDWRSDDLSSLSGNINLEDFGPSEWIEQLRHGGLAMTNVATEGLAPRYAASFQALQICAYATSGFRQQDTAVITLAVTSTQPRKWREHELALIDNVSARVWPLIERARSEMALRENEERLRLALSAANLGHWSWDAATDIIVISDRTAEIYGAPPGTRITRSQMRELLLPEDRERSRQAMLRSIETRTDYDIEYRLDRRGQEEVWVAARGRPTYREDGSALGMLGVVVDISERKKAEKNLRQRSERMQLLSEMLSQLLSARQTETIVQDLFPKVAAHLGVDTYFNFMVTEKGDALKLHSCAGIPPEVSRTIERLEFGQAICGTVAQNRSPIVANDIQGSVDEKAALMRSFGIQTYVCNPLLVGDRLLGTLSFASRTRPCFDPDELEFIRVISQHTAISLDRLRTQEELRNQARLEAFSAEIGKHLTEGSDLQIMLQRCSQAMVDYLGAALARIWTLHKNEAVLELQASAGLASHTEGVHARVPVGEGEIGRIALERRAHLSHQAPGNPSLSPQQWALQEGLAAFAGYPLIVGDRLIGVLALLARQPLSASAQAALERVVNQIAVGIERQLAGKALQQQKQNLEVINRIGNVLAGELDLEKLGQSVVEAGREISKAEFGAFFYQAKNSLGQSPMLHALSGITRPVFEQSVLAHNRARFAPSSDGEGVVRVADASRDPRFTKTDLPPGSLPEPWPVRSYLAVPVVSRSGEVIGGLFFGHAKADVFSEEAQKMLTAISAQAAVAIDNANLYQALKASRADLEEHAKTLEHRVAERTARLQETVAELESFSYSVSHDLRAPLRAMQSFATILEEDCAPKIGPEGKDYIRRIVTSAARMDRLIQDILIFSRVARTDLKLEPVDMDPLLGGILESYPTFHPSKADITLSGRLPLVLGNAAALTQCVSNLLGNAVKFVAPGVKPAIAIWAETRNDRVRLFFKDNGIGIDKESHERIFGIFQQLNKRYEGTGIGLAIVRKAAERMGGSVGLDSALNQGTTFWLELNAPQTP